MFSIVRGGALPLFFALAALPLAGPVAIAQDTGLGQSFSGMQIDGDKPISIESNQLDVDDAAGVATFSGNVQVVQGPTQLRTAKLVVTYDKTQTDSGSGGAASTPAATGPMGGGSSQIKKLDASGKVYVKSDDQVATGDNASFDMESELVVMTGQVVLSQGKNVAEGCRLTIQMKTGKARLESDNCPGKGGGGDGRVRMMLTPGQDGQASPAAGSGN